MSIPDTPSNTGFLDPQYGYNIDVKTHSYSDDPTPLSAKQGKMEEFFNKHTDDEHQKKYAKKAGKKLFKVLLNQVCH